MPGKTHTDHLNLLTEMFYMEKHNESHGVGGALCVQPAFQGFDEWINK